ncbi:MAG: single-stranded DNA-binding protein [Bacteroidota bacterium]|jgi:single-strand DNA-binding protein
MEANTYFLKEQKTPPEARENRPSNLIQLRGRIGGEILFFQSEKNKVRFNVSTNNYFMNKEGKTEQLWHSVVAWGNTADQVVEYLKTGDKVTVMGRIHNRKYIDKNNQTKTYTEIILQQFIK